VKKFIFQIKEKKMKILIGTDGSNFSRQAVLTACQTIINPADTEIKVVSVFQTSIPLDAFSQSAAYSAEVTNALQTVAESAVNEAVLAIQNHFPKNEINLTSLVKSGASDQVMIEIAQEWDADLIVVGSHGRGFWGRVMIGSVSDSLVHNAPCSVLVVRQKIKNTVNG
jgi:nucleotide-binding universal stress UspA family protein